MSEIAITSSFVAVDDAVRLHYLEAGSGRPVVFIPGWSQTAAMFRPQLDELSREFRVIAVDMRGHGQSEKPSHGYRIARLAADAREFLEALDLEDVVFAGHSMGCAIVWSYLEQFGAERLARLILIDQAPAVTAWPSWGEEEKALCGSLHTPSSLFDTIVRLSGPDGESVTANLIRESFFTKSFSEAGREWVIAENLLLPRPLAARLLLDLGAQDFRDVIPRIRLPALVIGAEKSIFNPRSQEWIARQIPDARVEIFEEQEGGSHFMWLENPSRFNALVRGFLN